MAKRNREKKPLPEMLDNPATRNDRGLAKLWLRVALMDGPHQTLINEIKSHSHIDMFNPGEFEAIMNEHRSKRGW